MHVYIYMYVYFLISFCIYIELSDHVRQNRIPMIKEPKHECFETLIP